MARLLTVLIFAILAAPALATDADVGFQCCRYSPDSVRILPGERVTWTGTGGATFADHPLRFDDATLGEENSGTTAFRDFPTEGIYTWYCAIHGNSGMRGRVAVTNNHLPVASFTASAADVASGTEVAFDANASSDPDPDQSLNYSWDLDGDGINDPGQTAVNPSALFTNTGTAPRNVTVRLTATDTNSDNVGPESATKTMLIIVAPVGATPPPPPPVTDTTPPKVALTLAKSLTVRSKLRLSFTTDEPATVSVTLKIAKKTAKATRGFTTAGRHALTIKLSSTIRRLLRHRRKVTLTLTVADGAGNRATIKRTLRLKSRPG